MAYDESSIQHLTGVAALRAKPQMYIGPTDAHGLFTILREVGDNGVDEALAGHCSRIGIVIDDSSGDRIYTVVDDGRGMPIGDMSVKDSVTGKSVRIPAIQAITSLLHAGGKLSRGDGDSAYRVSIGSHGVGIKATNFLSSWFRVFTFNKGSWWTIEYHEGELAVPLTKLAKPPRDPINPTQPLKSGTVVSFQPNLDFFSANKFPPSMLAEWATMKAYFTPGLTLDVKIKDKLVTLHFPDGVSQYIADRVAALNVEVNGDPFTYSSPLVDCLFTFSSYDGCEMSAFTNGLQNLDRGTHFDTFFKTLMEVVTPLAPKTKDGKLPFTVAELREGMIGVVNIKLSSPQFGGQTKEKLVDTRGQEPLAEDLKGPLTKWVKANGPLLKSVIEKAIRLKELKGKFAVSKTAINKIRAAGKKGFSPKAAIALNCPSEKRELFLVEGDSALGTARAARDSSYQEALPLRGKILNVGKGTKEDRVFENAEVISILAQLGFDPKVDDPMSKLRVGKIVLLADPDPDGPLAGDTLIPVRVGGVWKNVPIKDLASPAWADQPFKVLSWDGHRVVAADAVQPRVTSTTLEAISFLRGKSKVLCADSHKWSIPSRGRNLYRGELRDGLRYLLASDLKDGDHISSIEPVDGHESALAALKVDTLNSSPATRVRRIRLQDPTDFYCMTVPSTGNFITADGLVSSNCHISVLLLTLFYRFLPGLFERGMVYSAVIPEFYALDSTGKMWTGASADELSAKLKAGGVKAQVQHIKGYGEVNAKVLNTLAFNPKTRNLARISALPPEQDLNFWGLVGADTNSRKKLLGI